MRLLIVVATVALAWPSAAEAKPGLTTFSSCAQLVNFARAGAKRTGGGVGVVGRAGAGAPDVVSPPVAKTPTAAIPNDTASPAVPFSGTNVQELGVDEPDIVKTDGHVIYAITGGQLHIVDVDGAKPALKSTLALAGANQRMLIYGTRVLVIADKATISDLPRPVAPTIGIVAQRPTTTVTEIDASDPAHPAVARTMDIPGAFVDARQHGQTARLVVDYAPAPLAPTTIGRATLKSFLGHTVLRSKLSHQTFTRDLAPCTSIARPAQFSGLDVLAILTVDLGHGLYSLDRDGVMASPQVVYGSPDHLYVASRRYVRSVELGTDYPSDLTSQIDEFDISDPDKTTYVASGTVPGFILNSYALSEWQGDLRVATTEEPPWATDAPATTKSTVTVLGPSLTRIGSVTGLGAGERIYAVRFLGDRGYVVTYHQTDPLFALDLSDPTAPTVTGKLDLPGYSAYLHPITQTLLLGVGRDGDGVKADLFDVSDPAAPKLDSEVKLGAGYSPLETEPHAFLYWGPSMLAVFPLENPGGEGAPTSFTGAVALHAGPGAPLSEAGRITQTSAATGEDAPIDRALVIGTTLYTLSYLGLAENALDTLAPTGFTGF